MSQDIEGEETLLARYETKYLLSETQKRELLVRLEKLIKPDLYPEETIMSLYYDNENHDLVIRSLDKPVYKEKIRLRSYGIPQEDSIVFLEFKRKFNKVVYKRRYPLTYKEASDFMSGKKITEHNQILEELGYAKDFYRLKPSYLLSYDRVSFISKDEPSVRMTFDSEVMGRDYDFDLTKGTYGKQINPPGTILLEIKCLGSMPMWLVKNLSELKIYNTSYSKYGNAYRQQYETMNQ